MAHRGIKRVPEEDDEEWTGMPEASASRDWRRDRFKLWPFELTVKSSKSLRKFTMAFCYYIFVHVYSFTTSSFHSVSRRAFDVLFENYSYRSIFNRFKRFRPTEDF